MQRSERLMQQYSRNPVSRSESMRSEKSDRKVSFNKAVGVKHIPKGNRVKGTKPKNFVTAPTNTDEWKACSQVQHEPVSLDSEQLAEAAEDLIRVVDNVNCGVSGGSKAYMSLDRPKPRSSYNSSDYHHHNYSNLVYNNSSSGVRNENFHNPARNNLGLSSSSSSSRSKKNNNNNSYYNNLTATTTLPTNKNNNNNYKHLKNKSFHQSADPLPNPASPLVHSNRHEFKLTNHKAAYKSVPDLTATKIHNRNYNIGNQNLERDQERNSHNQNSQQNSQPLTMHHTCDDSTKVEKMIRLFNQDSTGNNTYYYPTTSNSTLPRGAVEPDSFNSHNNNQPFSYTSSNRVLSMETIRKLSPSPDSMMPQYSSVNRKRNSDDYSHKLSWDHPRNSPEKRGVTDYDHYDSQKRGVNDYSAKIIITNDYLNYRSDDDDDAYESYQIPPHDQFKILTEKTVTHSNSNSNNMNMSSIGVQTDQSESRGHRSRPKTRGGMIGSQDRGKPVSRGDSRVRSPQTTKIHNDLTSATLVRKINHGFGRHDRSPSPPPVPTYTGIRTGKHVIPLLSDTSDSEFEVKRTVDPLARIRSQVMERERLQEEEEEEEQRGRRIRTPSSTLESQTKPYSHHDMTPLTVDEVDALSLIMESDIGSQTLVVSNQTQSRTTKTRSFHHETRETRAQRSNLTKTDTPNRHSKSRESTPLPESKKTEDNAKKTRSGPPQPLVTDDNKKKKKKEDSNNNNEKKKKRRIKIKFFYDPKPDDDDDADPLARFQEFKGVDDDLDLGHGGVKSADDPEYGNTTLTDKYGSPELEEKKTKKNFTSIGKKKEKQPRGTTSTTTPFITTSLGRPRNKEGRSKPSSQSQGFSTLQQPIRGRPGRGGGGGGRRESESSTSPPRVVQKAKPLKPRYFGDTDLDEPTSTTTTPAPPPITTTTTNTRKQPQSQARPSKLLPSGPGDYRSLPNRVAAKNSSRNSSRRLSRGRSPASMASSRNSSESEVDSHASKASHVSTGSNRSVYLHATAVADIPVRRADSTSRQTDRQSDRQTDRQRRKVTRSFSLLAPWKPKHYKERYEVDYDRKTALPPRPPRRPPPTTTTATTATTATTQTAVPPGGKTSKLSTWLRKKRNKEAKGI